MKSNEPLQKSLEEMDDSEKLLSLLGNLAHFADCMHQSSTQARMISKDESAPDTQRYYHTAKFNENRYWKDNLVRLIESYAPIEYKKRR